MRRSTIAVAGIVLGMAAIGLIANPSQANPGGCTDGGPPGVVGTHVTPSGSPVYLGAEVFTGPYYGGGVCYHVPGVAGGIVYTWTTTSVDPTADRTVATIVRCEYVAGLVTIGCSADVTTDTTDDANWNTNGKATNLTVGTSLGGANVGSTGAYVGHPGTSPLDLPADSNGITSVGLDTGTGTCVWANGAATCPPLVPIAHVTIADGDVAAPGTHANSGACITIPGNPCVTTAPDGFGISVLKGHPNNTYSVTVAGVGDSRDLGGCIGFNAGPGC